MLFAAKCHYATIICPVCFDAADTVLGVHWRYDAADTVFGVHLRYDAADTVLGVH